MKLQEWIKVKGLKVVVIFEGGTIKRIMVQIAVNININLPIMQTTIAICVITVC